MDLQADLKWIHTELDKVKDPTLIKVFKNMLQYKINISERIDIDLYNKEIDEAISRVEKGEFHTQEEAEKIMDKW